jgi:predicted dehydrogenase
MAPIRIGVAGVTHPHAPAHLRNLELMDEIEGVILYDEDPGALEPLRERPKVLAVTTSLDELMRRDDVPVLFSLLRHDQAASAILRMVRAGKHVIAEKPVTRTAAELEVILDAAARRGVQVGAFYQNRWHPAFRQARELREAGALGRLMSVEARLVTTQVRLRNPRHWLFRRSLAGGGILSWLGCHYLDLVRYLTGEEIVAVSAHTATLSGEPIDVEDVAVLTFQLSNGALGTLHSGYLLAGGRPGYLSPGYDTYIGLRGTQGRLSVQQGPGPRDTTLLLESLASGWDHAAERRYVMTLPESEGYGGLAGRDFLRRFLAAALEGGEPVATGQDALAVLRIIEAAYTSATEGRTVRLA